MTIYCYRDDLESEKYGYYGVNLYFCWMGGDQMPAAQRQITDSFDVGTVFDLVSTIATIITGKGRGEVVRGTQNWINTAAPIVQFFRNCIDGGTSSTRCLALAKQAGIKYRRQNALALYKVLQLEREFETTGPVQKGPVKTTIDPPFDVYADVQQHFADQLETYMGMEYAPNDLSEEGSDDNDMEHGDFVFEIGEKKSATFRYWGHYHGDARTWKPLKMFDDFDMRTLNRRLLLRR